MIGLDCWVVGGGDIGVVEEYVSVVVRRLDFVGELFDLSEVVDVIDFGDDVVFGVI